ncbi:hypothetical protein [Streptomyces sp. NPDC101393]|uniref:hypothetical protein n=1 Tax=Streptomyces sp. NPDC101393 TaxID=3366141 RepID=UPI00381EE789
MAGRSGERRAQPSVVAPDAVRVRIGPPRRRRPMARREWAVGVPLMAFAGLVVAAILTATLAYALVGTDAPFLVNARGPAKGPASPAARISAGVLFTAMAGVVLAGLRACLRRRLAPACVAVDAAGVWLTRGRFVQQGLRWQRIAAVGIVAAGAEGATGAEGAAGVRAPFLDLYPVERAEDAYGPLGSRVLNAAPAAEGLRGRRYAIELTCPESELTLLAAELRRWDAPRPGGS